MHIRFPRISLSRRIDSVIGVSVNIGIGISISLLSLQATAQTSNILNSLSQCVDIKEIEERVACYDGLVGRSGAPVIGESSPPVVTEPSAPVIGGASAPVVGASEAPVTGYSAPPVVTNTEEQFGLKKPVIEEDKAKDELLATVAEVKETQPKKVLITLGNGQVWKQNIAKRFPIKEGDEIRIYPTGWGDDFRLKVVGKNAYIQVTRLR